jgi:hypothetical protein
MIFSLAAGDVLTDLTPTSTCPPKPVSENYMGQSTMCQNCAPVPLIGNETCIYDVSSCKSVAPGSSCQIGCLSPFVLEGNTTIGSCPAGNNIPALMLRWSKPMCKCPEPQAQQGYIKTSQLNENGNYWACASGYAGKPVVRCRAEPNCTSLSRWLDGCLPLQPCAVPQVDPCRYDVSRCTNVKPGGNCTISCKEPMRGGSSVAICKDNNVDPAQELSYYPLACSLDSCPDPSPWPPGYNKTESGQWVCAESYNGKAVMTCQLGVTWKQDCGTVGALSGCSKIVPCLAPQVSGLDKCQFDMGGCQSTPDGATCEVHCKEPFSGALTIATCPAGNTNPNGLIWTPPICSIASCDEPSNIPKAFSRSGPSEYICAKGYTGTAIKVCQPLDNCNVVPSLTGCLQLVPCEANISDCRLNTYSCISVQPGKTCTVYCKEPFSGNSMEAACPATNINPNGLVIPALPDCEISNCQDPNQPPRGYQLIRGSWQCASGYAGQAKKTCTFNAASCVSTAVMTGCFPTLPCVLPTLPDNGNCMYDLNMCRNVASGSSCTMSCKDKYFGKQTTLTCPDGNIQASTSLVGDLPSCDCSDPSPIPPAYNRTDTVDLLSLDRSVTVTYSCSNGYAGTAVKECKPGTQSFCDVNAVLRGCAVPIPCAASYVDVKTAGGFVNGIVNFGPALLLGEVNEEQITRYEVYFSNSCQEPIGQAISQVTKLDNVQSCCRDDVYSAQLKGIRAPSGAVGFLVVAVTQQARAPLGTFTPLNTTWLARIALTSDSRLPLPSTVMLTVAAIVATILLR